MFYFDPNCQSCWEAVSEYGFYAVIVGVGFEAIGIFKLMRDYRNFKPHQFVEKESAYLIGIEFLGLFLVLVGLAIESHGSSKAMFLARQTNNRLNEKATQAQIAATNAGERATILENQTAKIIQTNLLLRLELSDYERADGFMKIWDLKSVIDTASGIPKMNARIIATDKKSILLMGQLSQCLTNAGWNILLETNKGLKIEGVSIGFSEDLDFSWCDRTPNSNNLSQLAAINLCDSLFNNGVPACLDWPSNILFLQPTNIITITIGQCPEWVDPNQWEMKQLREESEALQIREKLLDEKKKNQDKLIVANQNWNNPFNKDMCLRYSQACDLSQHYFMLRTCLDAKINQGDLWTARHLFYTSPNWNWMHPDRHF